MTSTKEMDEKKSQNRIQLIFKIAAKATESIAYDFSDLDLTFQRMELVKNLLTSKSTFRKLFIQSKNIITRKEAIEFFCDAVKDQIDIKALKVLKKDDVNKNILLGYGGGYRLDKFLTKISILTNQGIMLSPDEYLDFQEDAD